MFTPCEVVLAGLLTVSPIQEASAIQRGGGELLAAGHFRKEPLNKDLEYGGGLNHLPVDCYHSPESLVDWARRIPEVREAMDEFARRGYVAVPEADTAMSGCATGAPVTGVTLAYLKPGAFIDSATAITPTIMVVTRLSATGVPSTEVSGGIVVVDGAASAMYSGDSLAMFRNTDPSFDVRPASFGGGGGPRKEVGRDGFWDPAIDPESRFNRYLRCTGWNTFGCVVTSLVANGGLAALKLALIMAVPHSTLVYINACLIGSAITCIFLH